LRRACLHRRRQKSHLQPQPAPTHPGSIRLRQPKFTLPNSHPSIAKSNSYFEGGYWLILWNFLVSAGLLLVLLTTGLSARMRNVAERVWPFRFARSSAVTLVYGAQYFLFTMILGFPLTIYQDFFREHHYGLSDQPLGDWLKDQAIGIAVGAVLGGIAIMVLYAILRRVQKSWWIWASVASVALLFVIISLAPVYIAPLFNKYETLNDPKLRDPILSLARANEIPAGQVYVFDESKQSKRVSANVSGALERCGFRSPTTCSIVARRPRFARSWHTRWGTMCSTTSTNCSLNWPSS